MDEIGPVGPIRFGRPPEHPQHPAPIDPDRRSPRRDPPTSADRVELTEQHHAALELVRERVLTATRDELRLPPPSPSPHLAAFVEAPSDRIEVFVGRLLSAQNALAAQRRGSWPEPRIDRALARATETGIAQTTEILEELGRLDPDNWDMLARVMAEYARKLAQL